MALIVDAGALYAQADAEEPWHEAVARVLVAEREALVTTEFAIAEADCVSYPRLKLVGFALALSPVVRPEQSGRLTAARRIFSAAIVSAWPANPHCTQENTL